MNYQRHPISSAFPELPADELRSLKESIKALGVLEPITVFEGMILDGWQRYCAAQQLGIPFRVEEFAGSRQDAVAFAVAKQTRRSMSQMQRAAVVIKLHASHLSPRGNRSKSAIKADFVSLKALAALTGIGERTLRRARRLEQQAVPSVKAVLSRGLITEQEAEKIAAGPKTRQTQRLRSLLELKRCRGKPFDPFEGVLLPSGQYVFLTRRDVDLATEVAKNGVPELRELIMSGKNLGLVAAACVARRSPDEQRKVLEAAPWVQGLRRLPHGRFDRRQLRRDPHYFERG